MGGSGVTDEPKEQLTCSQLFHKVFPEYLAMGMTYEQFWEQDCSLVIAYRKAYKLRQEEKNREAWLHGLYIFKALQCAPITVNGFAPKGFNLEPYPSQPIEFYKQNGADKKEPTSNVRDHRMDRGLAMMQMFAASVNRKFDKAEAKRKEKELLDAMNGTAEKEGVTKDGGRNNA